MADVLVTGGSGFIGGALVRALLADGREVRALARRDDAATRLAGLGCEVVHGDITEDAALRTAASGVDIVFHVAGLNATCLRDPSELERVNVGGTVAVVRAAAAAGVRRVVYTSSAATIGEPAGVVGTELTTHRGSYNTAYERSKHLAEIAAFGEALDLDVDLVAVNPSSVQGPGRSGGTAKILIAHLKGRLRFVIDTRMSLVSIDDVVRAHLAAEHRGRRGERYLVSGWTTSVSEAVELLGRLTGEARRVRSVPIWVVSGAARVASGLARLFRRDPILCPEMVAALRHGHAFDGSRIEREWGFEYTQPDRWLADTVDWYRQEGIV